VPYSYAQSFDGLATAAQGAPSAGQSSLAKAFNKGR
jgi:hypothetical protein